jgi:hypothetical protein
VESGSRRAGVGVFTNSVRAHQSSKGKAVAWHKPESGIDSGDERQPSRRKSWGQAPQGGGRLLLRRGDKKEFSRTDRRIK